MKSDKESLLLLQAQDIILDEFWQVTLTVIYNLDSDLKLSGGSCSAAAIACLECCRIQ
jgi:hypothetical protein